MRTSISIFALLFLVGCASFNSNAGKTLASVATSVDTAMKSYAVYVAVNNVPAQKQSPVRMAYGNYQLAMSAAESAYISLVKTGDRTAWVKASEALVASQGPLLALIAQITGKANP